MSQKPHYHSYLLRIWQTTDRGIPVWRASLESPLTGERRGFATLRDLYTYLQETTDKPGQGSELPNRETDQA